MCGWWRPAMDACKRALQGLYVSNCPCFKWVNMSRRGMKMDFVCKLSSVLQVSRCVPKRHEDG